MPEPLQSSSLFARFDFSALCQEFPLPLNGLADEPILDVGLRVSLLPPVWGDRSSAVPPVQAHDVNLYLEWTSQTRRHHANITQPFLSVVRQQLETYSQQDIQRAYLDAGRRLLDVGADANPLYYTRENVDGQLAVLETLAAAPLEESLGSIGNRSCGFGGHLSAAALLMTELRTPPVSLKDITPVAFSEGSTSLTLVASHGPSQRLEGRSPGRPAASGSVACQVEVRHVEPFLGALRRDLVDILIRLRPDGTLLQNVLSTAGDMQTLNQHLSDIKGELASQALQIGVLKTSTDDLAKVVARL